MSRKKPTATITPIGERLDALLLRFRTKQIYPLLTLLFNFILEILAGAIKEEKRKEKVYRLVRKK